MIFLTMGKDGSRAYYKGRKIEAAPFPQENTIETTGAGDTFTGCILNGLLDTGMENLTDEALVQMMTFANAAAALITTRRGALKVMPERAEVMKVLEKKKNRKQTEDSTGRIRGCL